MKREFKESVAENVLDMVDKAGLDWGSNYDPFDVFCGPYDCYKILGFDAEKDRDNGVTKKSLTKAYRKTSMKWHPDKNSSPDAKKMFQKISRANDVLGDSERKQSYDFYSTSKNDLYHRAFDKKLEVRYRPQTNVAIVLILLMGVTSLISWFMQRERWNNCVRKTAAGAAKRRTERNGGTPQTRITYEKTADIIKRHHKQLKRGKGETDLQILVKENRSAIDKFIVDPFLKVLGWDKLDKTAEYQRLEAKAYEIIASEFKDFGPGLHYPTHKDTLVYILIFVLPQRLVGKKSEEKED